MSKAITPNQVTDYKGKLLPAEVFDAFNELIVLNFVNAGSSVIVKQAEVVRLIKRMMFPEMPVDIARLKLKLSK